jgi:hypothetical protein
MVSDHFYNQRGLSMKRLDHLHNFSHSGFTKFQKQKLSNSFPTKSGGCTTHHSPGMNRKITDKSSS